MAAMIALTGGNTSHYNRILPSREMIIRVKDNPEVDGIKIYAGPITRAEAVAVRDLLRSPARTSFGTLQRLDRHPDDG